MFNVEVHDFGQNTGLSELNFSQLNGEAEEK